MALEFVTQILILLMSVVVHEVCHGLAALYYGDHTAEYQGRLTLNPLKHLDPVGSILLPALLFFTGSGVVFGWAKPVPYNPYNLEPGRWPEAAVALAGPASNFIIAAFFAILLRLGVAHNYSPAFLHVTATIVLVNLLLMVFNLVPVPPLDGSRLLFAIFPEKLYRYRNFFERYGFVLVIVFIFFLWQFVEPLVGTLFHILTGLSQ